MIQSPPYDASVKLSAKLTLTLDIRSYEDSARLGGGARRWFGLVL
jgi:hypothetical protein